VSNVASQPPPPASQGWVAPNTPTVHCAAICAPCKALLDYARCTAAPGAFCICGRSLSQARGCCQSPRRPSHPAAANVARLCHPGRHKVLGKKPAHPTAARCASGLSEASPSTGTGMASLADGGSTPKVVLLHGLARSKNSMESLAGYIRESLGLECYCIGYPSMSLGLADLAEIAAAEIRDAVGTEAEVWAVTHSMGGIVLRHIQALPEAGGIRWRGCCMIAPPNRGSSLSSFLSQVRALPS